jgi:hypothetical protein
MWSFIKKHWHSVGALVCGAGIAPLATVSPIAAAGLGLACGALGLTAGKAYTLGKLVGDQVASELEKKKLAEKAEP